MVQSEARTHYWKVALQVALVVGGVYTLFNLAQHWFAVHTVSGDMLYVGGMSFALCTVPIFLVAWVLLGLFGKKLMPPTSSEET